METPTQSPQSADELRHLLVENFKNAQPTLQAYYEYAKRASALATQYHIASLKARFPAAQFNERTLVCVLDSRETPQSLDRKLIELADAGLLIKEIVHDIRDAKLYLFL